MSAFRILLVDDEIEVLRALERTFRSEGYMIFSASDSEGALEILDHEDIDMLIADQRMPGMSGIDLLKRVKTRYPWILRMILTGYPDSSIAREAYRVAGTYRVLAKPWDPQHLRELVRHAHRYLELQSAHEALRGTLRRSEEEMEGILAHFPELGEVRRDEDGNILFENLALARQDGGEGNGEGEPGEGD